MNLPTLPMTREEFWRQYWDRIDCAGTVAAELPEPSPYAGCWIWTGATHASGYGVVIIQGKTWLAHRLAYEVFNGELEPGLHVLHSCNTKPCINPLHLRQGVSHENLKDAADDYGWVMPVTVYMTGASLAT